MESWEDQLMFNLNDDPSSLRSSGPLIDVKREISRSNGQFYAGLEEGLDANRVSDSWPFSSRHPQMVPVSSPTSCVTTLSGNILNFSGGLMSKNQINNQDRSSECNSTGNGGGAVKKARVTQSSAQPALKVRKEKLGDRISTLHQLVSPFGKTDTASVLSEAIGYIRFLHAQIEALSSPYMRNEPESSRSHHQHSFLNDFHIQSGGTSNKNSQVSKDLRSRGLCLIPMECIQHVENETGVDYWTQTTFGGGF